MSRSSSVLRHSARLGLVIVCTSLAACAQAIVRPSLSPLQPHKEALLVLPGFGYSRAGERSLRALAPLAAGAGLDLYVPTYISRHGLTESRANLRRFIQTRGLDRYERLHVVAFLAGAWTINPLVAAHELPNVDTIIYNRSPYQERAPRIAVEELRVLAWLRYGAAIFEMARTPYPPLVTAGTKVGLIVETRPTAFITKHQRAALRSGPFRVECDAFNQTYDDCLFVSMNHNELYVRFAEVWPQVLTFIRQHRFSER